MNPDPKRAVNDLTMEEWAVIARVFMKWPFRPNVSPFPFSRLVCVQI